MRHHFHSHRHTSGKLPPIKDVHDQSKCTRSGTPLADVHCSQDRMVTHFSIMVLICPATLASISSIQASTLGTRSTALRRLSCKSLLIKDVRHQAELAKRGALSSNAQYLHLRMVMSFLTMVPIRGVILVPILHTLLRFLAKQFTKFRRIAKTHHLIRVKEMTLALIGSGLIALRHIVRKIIRRWGRPSLWEIVQHRAGCVRQPASQLQLHPSPRRYQPMRLCHCQGS